MNEEEEWFVIYYKPSYSGVVLSFRADGEIVEDPYAFATFGAKGTPGPLLGFWVTSDGTISIVHQDGRSKKMEMPKEFLKELTENYIKNSTEEAT